MSNNLIEFWIPSILADQKYTSCIWTVSAAIDIPKLFCPINRYMISLDCLAFLQIKNTYLTYTFHTRFLYLLNIFSNFIQLVLQFIIIYSFMVTKNIYIIYANHKYTCTKYKLRNSFMLIKNLLYNISY